MPADLYGPVARDLEEIEKAVVHYGSSTGFFGKTLYKNGMAYLSAAVLYENMVIESYDKAKPEKPLVAIYPKEGTFWSDHPVGVVDAAWVTADAIDIVLNTLRTQVFHPESMTALGIDLSSRRIVIELIACLVSRQFLAVQAVLTA